MIESIANAKVKQIKKLQSNRRARRGAALFVIEGIRWVTDTLKQGIKPAELYCTPSFIEDLEDGRVSAESLPNYTLVSEKVMAAMSDVDSPPGILATVPLPAQQLPSSPKLLLILDQIQTPGNLGTMLRTAAAAGVEGVILTPGSVDAFNPKAVRGGMGAQLRVPIVILNWPEIKTVCADLALFVARADGELAYPDVDWQQPAALIIGNEARGASAEARALATGVTISMAAQTESLNAATASAIILFEARRQQMLRQ